METLRVYAAVRKDKNVKEEWVDLSTVSYSEEATRKAARKDEASASGAWLESNPGVRVGRFEMREIRG